MTIEEMNRINQTTETMAEATAALRELSEERNRYRAALESIRSLPQRFGHFSGHDAATKAVRIAKDALRDPGENT